MLCSYCENERAEPDRIFFVKDEKFGFCSIECTDSFKKYLSSNLKADIKSLLCCTKPSYKDSKGFVVCRSCGVVISEEVYDSGPEFQRRELMSLKEIEKYYSMISYLVD